MRRPWMRCSMPSSWLTAQVVDGVGAERWTDSPQRPVALTCIRQRRQATSDVVALSVRSLRSVHDVALGL